MSTGHPSVGEPVTGLPSTRKTSATKLTAPTNNEFGIKMFNNGLLDPIISTTPANVDDLRRIYTMPQLRGPPSFRYFSDAVAKARVESTIEREVQELAKLVDREGYTRAFNTQINNFPLNVGFNNGLSSPKCDYIEGVCKSAFVGFPIEHYIQGAVLYRGDFHSVTLPHLAAEYKGPGKDMIQAAEQCRINGAIMVYGRTQALKFIGKPDPPGHAHVFTWTCDGTTLNIFAHFAMMSNYGVLQYHRYRIKSLNLSDSKANMEEGRRAMRNFQEHARSRAMELKDQILAKHHGHPVGQPPFLAQAPAPQSPTSSSSDPHTPVPSTSNEHKRQASLQLSRTGPPSPQRPPMQNWHFDEGTQRWYVIDPNGNRFRVTPDKNTGGHH